MKVAIYPGSFNPWHEGHTDVLKQALKVFDVVNILIGINPDKPAANSVQQVTGVILDLAGQDKVYPGCPIKFGDKRVYVDIYTGLLKDHIKFMSTCEHEISPDAIIKGIRDPQDFLYEQKMQYHNEDLGITIPTYYVIAKRDLVHISSSAIRGLEKFKKG